LNSSTLFSDYRENLKLDTYELSDIDDEEYEDLDRAERLQAEREMARRDRHQAGTARSNVPGFFLDDLGNALCLSKEVYN
jgi:hypothetical protein